jgi:hypothetical protein
MPVSGSIDAAVLCAVTVRSQHEDDEHGTDRIEHKLDREYRHPDAARELVVIGTQQVAKQDRQHQHEAVQHRHHDGRPPPLQCPTALGPQFGGRQRRIDGDNTGADGHAHRGGLGRQRHDGGYPGDRAQNQPRQVRFAAVEHARGVPDHAAGDETDGIQHQRKHLAKRASGERPERDRGGAQQIGGSPPFQRRDVLLLAEKQQHGSEHRRDHRGNEIKRGGIEGHGRATSQSFYAQSDAESNSNASAPSASLFQPSWKTVGAGAQVFTKKLRQLIGKYPAKRAPEGALSQFLTGSIYCKF